MDKINLGNMLNDAKWSHATDITNMGQINYYFLQRRQVRDNSIKSWYGTTPSFSTLVPAQTGLPSNDSDTSAQPCLRSKHELQSLLTAQT